MITPELIGYIRGELGRGRSRDAIHASLVAEGGWSEIDLNEAFRVVIPMQGSIGPTQNKTKSYKKVLENLIFILVGVACVLSWYFYRPQITDFWNKGVGTAQELSIKSWNWLTGIFKREEKTDNTVVPTNNATVQNNIKDCGTTSSPDPKNQSTYRNNAVLACLGDSAFLCEDAKGILNDPLFPSVFQIVKNQDSCSFKLSYDANSALVDKTGKKLALQYISCPISVVKAVDESKNIPVFSAPRFQDLSLYASQIYFYGILGVFMETNVDKSAIQALGCSGPYIDSVIASYNNAR